MRLMDEDIIIIFVSVCIAILDLIYLLKEEVKEHRYGH